MRITRTIKSSLAYNLGLVILSIGGILMLQNKDNAIIFGVIATISLSISIVLMSLGWLNVKRNNRKIKRASRKFKQLKPEEVRWKVERGKELFRPYRLVCNTVYGNFITKGTDIVIGMRLFNIYKDEIKNEYYVEVII